MATPLHFVDIGTGTPVLAVHGWTPDHRLLTGPLEPLFEARPGYRRLYPDLPGMGKTPVGDTASSDDLLAALLTLVDEQFGTEPFLLIGASYGGYLARAVVSARPEQVLGLAVVCPVGTQLVNASRDVPEHVVLRSEPGLLESLDPAEADEFGAFSVVHTTEVLQTYRRDVASGLALADEAALARIKANWAFTAHGPETGPRFDRPTLILCGRQDSVTGYAEPYTLLPHYPRATYAVLDFAGHNLQIEQYGLMVALIDDWLDRVGFDQRERGGAPR